MFKRWSRVLTAATVALAMALPVTAIAGKPTTMKGCLACHTEEDGVLRGKFVGYSEKFQTVQLDIGPLVWVLKADAGTKLEGVGSFADIEKGKETKVLWKGTEKDPVASVVKPKPPMVVPDEEQVSFEELQKLIRSGSPEAKGYTIADSRPPEAYSEGHIPYAVNLPYPKLKKMGAGALPEKKDSYIIFYCGGFA